MWQLYPSRGGQLFAIAEGLVILIGGGTKKRQSKDIAAAKERWADYNQRKKQERE